MTVERGDLQVYPNPEALATAVADCFIAAGRSALSKHGSFHVALAGGNTPRAAYALLGRDPRRNALPWNDVYVYFGDERCVPPTDERSNYRMAQDAFLGAVGIPAINVHRIAGEIDPGHAANQYASILRASMGQPPHFDLMLLGMGPDGHTASLFPGSPPDDDRALVRAVYYQPQAMWRISMTPTVLNAARMVVFAVEGTEKAGALAAVLKGPFDPGEYPAQIVHPTDGQLVWMVDRAAAHDLEGQL